MHHRKSIYFLRDIPRATGSYTVRVLLPEVVSPSIVLCTRFAITRVTPSTSNQEKLKAMWLLLVPSVVLLIHQIGLFCNICCGKWNARRNVRLQNIPNQDTSDVDQTVTIEEVAYCPTATEPWTHQIGGAEWSKMGETSAPSICLWMQYGQVDFF
jgi:hypothetical protein